MTAPLTETLVGTLTKGTDVEVHVRNIEADGFAFLDIREYIPSSETYGRGLLIPADQKKALLALLKGA